MADHRWPSPNHNYVPEFQLSGIPYAITANIANNTTESFTFNSVTRWISISSDVDVQLGFNDDETIHGNYYFICKAGMTQRFELKCKKIVIKKPDTDPETSANVSILAGLTNVASTSFPDQTNENGFIVE